MRTSKSPIKSQTFDYIIETFLIPNIKLNTYFNRLSINNNIIIENTIDESERHIDINDLIIELILTITINRKSRLKDVKAKIWILNFIYKRQIKGKTSYNIESNKTPNKIPTSSSIKKNKLYAKSTYFYVFVVANLSRDDPKSL